MWAETPPIFESYLIQLLRLAAYDIPRGLSAMANAQKCARRIPYGFYCGNAIKSRLRRSEQSASRMPLLNGKKQFQEKAQLRQLRVQDIDIRVPRGSLAEIVGLVGAAKSILL